MRFHGTRAVVTGGSSGIGRATALRLAVEGARVFVGGIVFLRTDVTKESGIVAFLAPDDARFVTGTHLLADGGMLAGTRASRDRTSPSLANVLERFR